MTTNTRFLSSVFALLLLVAMGFLASGAQAASLPGPIVSAQQLKTLVDSKSVVVLDTRELFQTDGKTPNYAAGHIPGSRPAPYSLFRGPKENPGAVMPLTALTQLVASLGLDPQQAVVLAGSGSDATEFGGVARIYWNLKAAGFGKLAVLNGGTGAWMAAKLPLEKGEPAKIAPSKPQLTYNQAMVVGTDELNQLAKSSNKPLLIDARPEDFFLGEMRHPQAARWGTLPGAKHWDSEEWFVANTGRLLDAKQLRSIAQREGFLAAKPQVSFCNAGHWAATHWFILSEVLGQKNVRMYPESVVAWSKAGLPMDNEPSRSTALMRQVKGIGIMKN
jgi:thiosulfate/3-mercaptopyruvate sulfurtransferase